MRVDCVICGKKDLGKDTTGINRKLLGTDITNFYCMECLAEYLGCTVEELLDKIEEFKEEAVHFLHEDADEYEDVYLC